ncbi:STAS domain-containing protein [Capillimicrobium parvum]|uniref:STAS domain-containing protein n=1 Tax=Capillimicrobium parvum TaxID=2884022 RepID=UPI00216AFB0A|nr:STAS domain-containing protein [Capillimicrobium parvum]
MRLRRHRELRVLSVELSHEALIVLDGHLVTETASTFEQAIAALTETSRVVLDLSRLRGIDRAGAAALARLRRSPDQELLAFAGRRRVRRRVARHPGAGLVLLPAPAPS